MERSEAAIQQFVQRCVDKVGKDFLANVGTANVVKDLDALRTALGDDKLTFLGYSYGTDIASSYAESYPDKVRALILDGVVDPNLQPLDDAVRTLTASQAAFDDFAAACATQPDCPLGTDPAKAVDVYHTLVDPLVDKPAPTADGRGLSFQDAVTATDISLYSRTSWEGLAEGLRGLQLGNDGSGLLAIADSLWGRDSAGHYETNLVDALTAIGCVDDPWPTDQSAWVAFNKDFRPAQPYAAYGSFTGYAPRGSCAFWPVSATGKPHQISVQGLPPILVVSTTGDPATPYQACVDVAKQLGAALLTYEGTQHTVVFEGNECVDDIATKYLIDVTAPPECYVLTANLTGLLLRRSMFWPLRRCAASAGSAPRSAASSSTSRATR